MTKLRFLRNQFGEAVTGIESLEPFYQLYGEVQVEKTPGTGTYTKTAGFLMDPALDLTSFFILNSGYRGYFLAPHFNPFSVNEISMVSHNILKGKFYTSESFGEPPEIQLPLTEVEDYVVLKAGISHSVGFDAGMARINSEKKFLTWHPVIKTVGLDQPELLHFLIQDAAVTGVNLQVKISYTDGTETAITPRNLSGISQWDLLRIPVGITVLELASLDFTRLINFYEVWLEDQSGNVISESRFYELDHNEQPWERLWLYENSLGMPEVLRTVGKTQYQTAISHTSGKRSLSWDYDVRESQFFTNGTLLRTEQEISTGHLRDKETAAYMMDFLSQKATLYELRNGDYFPMQLIPGQAYEERSDGDYNYFLRFLVAGAFENQSYTP